MFCFSNLKRIPKYHELQKWKKREDPKHFPVINSNQPATYSHFGGRTPVNSFLFWPEVSDGDSGRRNARAHGLSFQRRKTEKLTLIQFDGYVVPCGREDLS